METSDPGPANGSTTLHQITEDDLCNLERLLPILCDRLILAGPPGRTPPELRVKVEKVKKILSDVRWNYQPYLETDKIPADEGSTE